MCKMRIDNLLKLADGNLANTIKHRMAHAKNGKLIETESYILYTIGIDNEDGHLNGVLCLEPNCEEELLQKAEEFFEPVKRDYVFWIRQHSDQPLEKRLLEKGLTPKRSPGSAGMVIKDKINAITTPLGFQLRPVTTSKEVQDFALVVQAAFEKPAAVAHEMFSSDTILISPYTRAFVLYQHKKPVAAASMTLSEGIAGLYWVSTVKDLRGRGLGSYITQEVTNAGFDAGAQAVILQASIAGERIYSNLGFETITRYRWYPVKY